MRGLRRSDTTQGGRRGQSMVEYAISVPVFLLVLLGMLEFGFAFSHHLTMEYSTREGVRTGSGLAAGTAQVKCDGLNDDNVDNQVISAVQRVLTGAGSQLDISEIGQIHIYRANDVGGEIPGDVNVWVLGAGPSVGGVPLRFKQISKAWDACDRKNTPNPTYPDSIGVSISYDYNFVTPLGGLLGITGSAHLHMTDRTVMALNPVPQTR